MRKFISYKSMVDDGACYEPEKLRAIFGSRRYPVERVLREGLQYVNNSIDLIWVIASCKIFTQEELEKLSKKYVELALELYPQFKETLYFNIVKQLTNDGYISNADYHLRMVLWHYTNSSSPVEYRVLRTAESVAFVYEYSRCEFEEAVDRMVKIALEVYLNR